MLEVRRDFSFEFSEARLEKLVVEICTRVKQSGGRALLVGGGVRDSVLGKRFNDVDIEVHGITGEKLQQVLQGEIKVFAVGKSYNVFAMRGEDLQISVADYFPANLFEGSLVTASRRRDLTINSLAYDPLTGELFDSVQGLKDLKDGLIRHVSSRFSEDHVRVLRIMQLAARYQFDIHPETIEICRKLSPRGISRERIFPEWKKLLTMGHAISNGLNFLKDCHWLKYFPGLEAMVDCPQDPEWHPEGDVWVHTLHCLDSFASNRVGVEAEDLVVGLAVLCHDIGKPATTTREGERIRSVKHELVGMDLAREFLLSITPQVKLVNEVLPLVRWHMVPGQYFRAGVKDKAIRKLADKVERIDRLVRVSKADYSGRPPLPSEPYPDGEWLLSRAEELRVSDSAPVPIIQGRDLLAEGLQPSKEFGPVIKKCYLAQLNGEFNTLETGKLFLRKYLSDSGFILRKEDKQV